MTLKNYYQNLPDPKEELKRKIMDQCGISEATFYKWMNGDTQNIPKPSKETIAKITGINVKKLFPQLIESEQ